MYYTLYISTFRYYGSKKQSAIKEKKTIDSSSTVLKMAEKKTKQTLKDMQVVASINKVRKTYWFEKFYWFISSENYLGKNDFLDLVTAVNSVV